MLIQVLKSKLKEVIVTAVSTEYDGSITLDPNLMRAAKLRPFEKVEVNAKNGESRIVTYVIKGTKPGQVELNGGAANFFNVGDYIHVNCFTFLDPTTTGEVDDEYETWFGTTYYDDEGMPTGKHKPYFPKVVKTDENNKVI